eukprot:CAMPEP_0168612362 /NCGR_PEP_ID=MMETSP0449_2-20121227/2877_1 /TAXON_ID=1082188 /ORGANISM="Strombidium rassoulzadegani, Strain ras09" /LENGTH=67 /DNA_ID=CAMNT_0008652923 /DNA_START=191 /DNA_END=394 /DNA_ORIENTATION=+
MKVSARTSCGSNESCIDPEGKSIKDFERFKESETLQLLNLEEAAPKLALMQLVEVEDVNGQFQTFLL